MFVGVNKHLWRMQAKHSRYQKERASLVRRVGKGFANKTASELDSPNGWHLTDGKGGGESSDGRISKGKGTTRLGGVGCVQGPALSGEHSAERGVTVRPG